MWTLALSLALGAPAVEAEALEQLPWRVSNAEDWRWTDRRATRIARAGSWTAAIGGLATLAGAGFLVLGEETSDDAMLASGAFLVVTGTITSAVGPPIALGGSLRARRSLRQRGVFVSPASSIVGWTLYGTGLFAIPGFAAAAAGADEGGGFVLLGTAWYATMVALPLRQIDLNRRGREGAGLAPIAGGGRARPVLAVVPSRNGVALAGAF